MAQTAGEKSKIRRELVRHRIRNEILTRGGMCEWPGCEISDPLQWHHLDPALKLFRIMNTRSFHKSDRAIEDEMAKCKLLCEGHHHLDHAYMILGWERPWQPSPRQSG